MKTQKKRTYFSFLAVVLVVRKNRLMDTNSFPDNDKATANNRRRHITWITIIIVLAVVIIALVVSLFAFRTSRLEANDTKVPNIESKETEGIENKNTDYIDDEKDIYVEIIDEYWDDDIPLDTLRDKDGVYLVVPEGPEYPGGSSALFEFIKKTMIYPAAAVKDSIQGKVIVQFIVEEDGSITNPVVVKSSGLNRNQAYSSIFNQLDAEAIRIISAMPKWNPGKIESKPCRVRYNLPINFRIEYAQIRPAKLKPGTIISGIVSDASTGEPIGNALIIETVENDTAAYYYTRTDRDGRFSYPLFGTGHVLKVIANLREYKSVKIPLENRTTYEIKLEKDPDGDGGDGVMYTIGPFDLRDSNTPEGREKLRSGSNISVVKPGSLRDDGEGILIEEIE